MVHHETQMEVSTIEECHWNSINTLHTPGLAEKLTDPPSLSLLYRQAIVERNPEDRVNVDWMEIHVQKIATEVSEDKDKILSITRSHYKYIEKFLGREEELKQIEQEHLSFA